MGSCPQASMEEVLHTGSTQQESYSVHSVVAYSAPNTVGPRTALCRKPTKKLVGFVEQRDKLKKMLTGDSNVSTKGQPKVVLIVGSRGLGKTALAGTVFVELKPKTFEGTCAFVSVGWDPNVKKVFEDVLSQTEMKDHAFSDEETACKYLRDYLSHSRYFIVFDDICNLETWDKIQRSFPYCKYNGTVLATTRSSEISRNFGDNVLKLEPLSDDHSKELFYRATFGVTEEIVDKDHLARVSDKVDIRKCGGVPLAILAMASRMAGRPMNEWSGVYNSPDFCSNNGSLNDADTIMNIIPRSILDLPAYLRPCLLYLSMFPVDHWIVKDGLIWKWIAEDFVQKEDGKGLFELGEGYFSELIKRSMIQPENRYDETCFLEGCRVHSVVLDQIQLLSSQETFVGVLGIEQCMPSRSNVRRLCIEGERIGWKHMISTYKMPEVWSLCASRCGHINWVMPSFGFRALKVLDLFCCSFQITGTFVMMWLSHLKYLGLAGTPINRDIAEHIWMLRSLQTLDLRRTGLRNLPNLLPKQLICLWCDDRTKDEDDCIMYLRSLQNLQVYSEDKSPKFVQELSRLTELRVLRIGMDDLDDEQEKFLGESLGALQKLTCLEIRCTSLTRRTRVNSDLQIPHLHHLRNLSLEGICLPSLPAWITPSCALNLSRLAFAVEVLMDSDVSNLRGLPELTCLNMVVGHSDASPDREQDQRGRPAFEKLRFFTTNVPPSRFLCPRAASLGSLEAFQFVVNVKDAKTEGDTALGFPCLKLVTILLNCWGASDVEAMEAVQSLRQAAKANPNHPDLLVIREKTDAKAPLLVENPEFHLLWGPELAKMRTNQENLRRIQLHDKLRKLDEDFDKLKVRIDHGS